MSLFLACTQLHFGADGGTSEFAIERQAVNEATFLCPDELGWQPQVDSVFLINHSSNLVEAILFLL